MTLLQGRPEQDDVEISELRREVSDFRKEISDFRDEVGEVRGETSALTVAMFGHPDAPGKTGLIKDVAETKEAVVRGVDRVERLYQSLITFGGIAVTTTVAVLLALH